jgi:hypothetical protein
MSVKAKTRLLILVLFVSAVSLMSSFCGRPGWLAGPSTVAELLASEAKVDKVSMAGGDQYLLLAALRRGTAQQPTALFAVRADAEGRILDRWILTELAAKEDIIDLSAVPGENGPAVLADVYSPGEAGTALVWRFSKDCLLQGSSISVPLSVGEAGDFNAAGIRIVPFAEADYLFYRVDFAAPADGRRSVLAVKSSAAGESSPAKILTGFANPQDWGLLSAAAAPDHLVFAWYEKKPDRISVLMAACDGNGAVIGNPVLLYDTPRRVQSVRLKWNGGSSEWVVLWGSQRRHRLQRIPYEVGSGLKQAAPEGAKQFDIGADMVDFGLTDDGFKIILCDTRSLWSADYDWNLRATGETDLISPGEGDWIRINFRTSAWLGARLAVLYGIGDKTALAVVTP